ncbi:MAG: TlpA family protein disulfide reductase [Prevotella sp.]|nr:TlpA family protein disulfide reductase [Prevotella sp.]MBR1462631.1 TlpA family protein disulfide reductase [Prevotella sp.]
MKRLKVYSLSLLLMTATVTVAQNTIIRGSFKKAGVQNVMNREIYVGTADNGNLKQALANILKPEDYSFQFGVDNSMGIFDQIAFIGSQGELYPLYVGKNEEIEINVDRGRGVLSGKIGKENEVLAKWIAIMTPLRQLVYTSEGRAKPAARFHQAITKATEDTDLLLATVNTGNSKFDADVRKVLYFMTMLDVLHMFDQGMCFNSHEDYPDYIQRLFSSDVFKDSSVMKYCPLAFDLLTLYGFGKHIIYDNQMGSSAEYITEDISCKELRSSFIVDVVQRGMVWDLKSFDEKHGSEVLPAQREKYEMLKRRITVNQEGGDWIDFTYPDITGKMHSLSDYLGRVVVVDVWATWCAPCKAEIPHLQTLEKEFEGKDVVFISLSIDTEKEKWSQFVKEKGLGGIQLITYNKGTIVDDYAVDAVPRFMVFSRHGKTVSTNAPRPSTPELKEMIERALKIDNK